MKKWLPLFLAPCLFLVGCNTSQKPSPPLLNKSNYDASYTVQKKGNGVQFNIHVSKWGRDVTANSTFNEGTYFVATTTNSSGVVSLQGDASYGALTNILNKYFEEKKFSTLGTNSRSVYSFDYQHQAPEIKITATSNASIPMSDWRLFIVDVRQSKKNATLNIEWIKNLHTSSKSN